MLLAQLSHEYTSVSNVTTIVHFYNDAQKGENKVNKNSRRILR